MHGNGGEKTGNVLADCGLCDTFHCEETPAAKVAVLYANARIRQPGEKSCSDNRRKCLGLSSRRDSDDDSTDEVKEKQVRPEKVTAPDPLPTRTRNGIDFSGCFSFLVSGSDPSPPASSQPK